MDPVFGSGGMPWYKRTIWKYRYRKVVDFVLMAREIVNVIHKALVEWARGKR